MRLALALLLAAGAAAAEEGLRCAPDHPVLCENVHVSCAGRSRVPAPVFTVLFSGQRAAVAFAGGEVWDAGVSRSHSGTVLRPETGRDWVRLAPDGRFSLRRYRGGRALMAAGACRAAGWLR